MIADPRALAAPLQRLCAPHALAPTVPDALLRYCEHLARFGAHTDLVGARDANGLVEIALSDALELAASAPGAGRRCVEVGAGGASVLIPWALMDPTLTGVLYEPRQKRATFLRLAVGVFGLAARLQVRQARLEAGQDVTDPGWDLAIARAVFAPDVWLVRAVPLLAPGGHAAVLTTSAAYRGPAPDTMHAVLDRGYRLPFSGADRTVTWFRRDG